jgi:hypothetical protein
MESNFLKGLVWLDYKLFVILCLIIPLVLTIWGIVAKIPSIQKLLLIFWRVASLLAISIYLLIPVWQLGYLAWFIGHIFVAISLWFWLDINDEIRDLRKSPLKLTVTAWRWATTVFCSLSAIAFIPFLHCSFSADAKVETACRIWLEAPWQYKAWFHPNASTGFLGFLGMSGLIIYTIYFLYFLVFRLIKQGRIALEQ